MKPIDVKHSITHVMTLSSHRVAKVIALLIFVGAFMYYYHSGETSSGPAQVLVNDGDRVLSLKFSHSEILRLMQVGRVHAQGHGEVRETNGSVSQRWAVGQDPGDHLIETTKKVQDTGDQLMETTRKAQDTGDQLMETTRKAQDTGDQLMNATRKVQDTEDHESKEATNTEVDDGCNSEAGAAVWTHPVLKPSEGSYLSNLDLSAYSKQDRLYLKSRLGEMTDRIKLLNKGCSSRSNLAVSTPLSLVWQANHTPNILWCPTYKASPTGWLKHMFSSSLLKGDGITDFSLKVEVDRNQKTPGSSPPPDDPQDRDEVFKKSLRVLVVRNPYARIVAAYLDKIATTKPLPGFFTRLQRKIIKKYRKKKNKTAKKKVTTNFPYPTFPEFVAHLIDTVRSLHTPDDWKSKVHCWRPYWVQCNVCAADYDLILKMETLEEDEKFLLTLANVTDLKNVQSSAWRPPGKLLRVDHYLEQLDRRDMGMLHDQYLLDFDFFGYVKSQYLETAYD
ncbi:carbohydrate sulfotransferase 11-like [Panulirus ornatus]|uniref:carbohydrate sulfotransferase 11-like n=1 Tax=Panulirus ornatus TaxID=150431 RepID=UPI003A89F4E3